MGCRKQLGVQEAIVNLEQSEVAVGSLGSATSPIRVCLDTSSL